MKLTLRTLACCFLLSSLHVNANGSAEDQIFDANRVEPVELLYQAYQQGQVLLIGTSNHSNFQHYDRVLELLELVGNDPNLKYIVMERSHEVDEFYERLSTNGFDSVVRDFPFSSEKARTDNLCLNPEWSYTIKEFLPKLREMNKSRLPLRPILVRGMEGMPAELSAGPMMRVNDGTCSGTSFGSPPNYKFPSLELFALSRSRELKTQENFEKSIWNDLKPNEKVIYISHYMHLIDGFEGCRPSQDEDGNWTANVEPLTWLHPFFLSHPEARKQFKIILMDEKDDRYNPAGGLKLVQRQSLRFPGEDFAFSTKPFEGVALEEGAKMFLSSATINKNRFNHKSEKTLDQVFDGVIWNANAHVQFSLKPSREYLPGYCDR